MSTSLPPNALYYGDNLDVLRRYVADESVDLCYIDPPFNSKRNYNQIYNNLGQEDRAQAQAFVDTWLWDEHAREGYRQITTNFEGRFPRQLVELIVGLRAVLGEGSLLAYVTSMALRIVEIHRVLKPAGSFYLHCDPTSSHYLKLILDAVFCSQGGEFRNELIWKRTSGRKGVSQFGRVHDVIFFYSKSQATIWNPPSTPFSEENVRGHDIMRDQTGKLFRVSDFSGAGIGPARRFGDRTIEPPKGRHWMFDQDGVDRLMLEGRILFSAGGRPRLKTYLEDLPGVAIHDVWTDVEPINAAAQERLGYPTQKPEALLERIVGASSNEGDTILDAYCGCGTTIAVAQRLGRRWIGMDITYQSISLILRRLEQAFGRAAAESVYLKGVPRDFEAAVALAHRKDDRLRKEFEKWAVLTYTNNRAVINEKKGADRGVDGMAYFQTGKDETARVVLQVKSGSVKRSDVATLRGDMDREQAELAVLLTLEDPTRSMVEEAKAAGQYFHEQMGRRYDRIQVVPIREMLEHNRRLDIPMSLDVLKSAQWAASGNQLSLNLRRPAASELPVGPAASRSSAPKRGRAR